MSARGNAAPGGDADPWPRAGASSVSVGAPKPQRGQLQLWLGGHEGPIPRGGLPPEHTGDVCLYLLTDYEHGAPRDIELMLCLYVDDISIAASSIGAYDWFINTLGNRFPINSDETGKLEWLLSMAINYDYDAGTLQLT